MDKRLGPQDEHNPKGLNGETPLPDDIPMSVFSQLQDLLEAMNTPQASRVDEELGGQIKSMFEPGAAQSIVKNTEIPMAPAGFADQVIEHIHQRSDQEFAGLLQALPELQAPEGFAAQVTGSIQDDLLAANLQSLKATVPEGFAAQVMGRIQDEQLSTVLQALPSLKVPEGFAAQVMERIQDEQFSTVLQALPELRAPEGFAAQVTERIQDEQFSTVLQALPSLKVPEGFAAQVMERIQDDVLTTSLQNLKATAPQGFSHTILQRIQEDHLATELQALPQLQAPEGFAAQVMGRIQDEQFSAVLQALPEMQVPEGFAAQVMERIQDEQFSTVLQALPELRAPEGFAAQVTERIQDDVLTASLQSLKATAPQGFSHTILQRIQQQGEAEIKHALQGLPRQQVPEGFAARLLDRMQDEVLQDTLQDLKVQAPAQFASQVLSGMQQQAETEFQEALHNLPALKAPEGFAAHVASRIARDAQAAAVHNPAPLYLVGMALTAAAFFIFTFVLPNMQVGVGLFSDLLSNVSNLMVGVLLMLAGVSAFALLSKVRFAPQLTCAAFAAGLLVLSPGLQGAFGSLAVPPQQEMAQVVRVGGDVVVRGHVTGDVVAIGGDIKLVQGARVDGRTVSILGDVSMDEATQVASAPTAILGRINGVLPGTQLDIVPVGVASAFVPLVSLMRAEYWPALYFAFLCVITLLMYQSGHGLALLKQSQREPGRNLALGYVTVLVTVPVLLLSNLGGNALLLGVGIFLLLGLSAGMTLSMLLLGAALSRRFAQPNPAMYAVLGLALYLLLLPFPMLASLGWLLGGCYGLGALLNYFRKTNVAHLKPG